MTPEPNLRDLFGAGTPGGHDIDTAAVIRRAKRRRLPARLGVGGAALLLIGGIGVASIQGLGGASVVSSSGESTAYDASTEQQDVPAAGEPFVGAQDGTTGGDDAASQLERAPADRLNLCGGARAEVAPSATGLIVTATFAAAPAGSATVAGTVTLTNTGTAQVAGYTSATPAITLAQGGVVLWHSNGPTIQMARDFDLAPGESLALPAFLTPVVCGVEDDSAGGFRPDLPAAPAGDYEVTAAADVMVGDTLELVTGPIGTLRLE
jgi:hypothetical protein